MLYSEPPFVLALEERIENMNWKKLFATHILERGYNYYCEDAVENLDVSADIIRADVIGTEDYEVEISFNDGEISNMYCSCPYAEDGNNCKHMAAVLYKWTEGQKHDKYSEGCREADKDLFARPVTLDAYKKKIAAVNKLVEQTDIDVVRSYLVSILTENEKLLVRFSRMVKKQTTEKDIERYIAQINNVVNCYLGKNRFINYYETNDFISELEEILDKDVRCMIDNADYISAFRLMNYIFVLIGNVDMDDSGGSTGVLADSIYQLWLKLLVEVDMDEKQAMFCWFTTHLDTSIADYLEEYIEQIIMNEFNEKEFEQPKLQFIEDMLHKTVSKESDWSRSYAKGKWAIRYLEMIEKQKKPKAQIEEFCRKWWDNSSVRKYYIDYCMKDKRYDHALEALDESISMDKAYRGLISEYSKKKKGIYLLQGNKEAYIKQLWKLELEDEAGDLDTYKELKKQYTVEEWAEKREELFGKLPEYAPIDRLYKEEKLYDRLLDFVMKSTGLHALQEYENILKKEYPEQILQKYKDEVNNMASYAGDRKKYQQLVALLRRMMRIRSGSKIVEDIVIEWKNQYRNRPAMMEELRKL